MGWYRFFKATWGWRVVLNWMTEDVTTWHGLQTDSLGRLVHLSLSGNNIIGESHPPNPAWQQSMCGKRVNA